jgi:uncharacterized membrane protein
MQVVIVILVVVVVVVGAQIYLIPVAVVQRTLASHNIKKYIGN